MKSYQLLTLTGPTVGVFVIACVGSFAVADNAKAALLFSDTDSFTNQRTELVGMPELTVGKYTPPAGVNITEVQIMLSGTLKASGSFKNNNSQTVSFEASSLVNQFDLVPDDSFLSTVPIIPAFTTIGSQVYTLVSGETSDFGPFVLESTKNVSFTGADIANFLGSGDITYVPFTQVINPISGLPSNLAFSFTTVAGASLTINYFGGTSTPEPSAVLGLGILTGLGFIHQKRTSKKL